MADDDKKDSGKKEISAEIPASTAPENTMEAAKFQRNIQMFERYLNGKTMTEISEEFKMSLTGVSAIAKKFKWKALVERFQRRQHRQATNRLRVLAPTIQNILEADINEIVALKIKENRLLTASERGHLLSVWDRAMKEIRLDDGNPTDIPSTSDKVKIEIVLPAGAKDIGILPPSPTVTFSEKKPDEKADEDVIDLEMIEDK